MSNENIFFHDADPPHPRLFMSTPLSLTVLLQDINMPATRASRLHCVCNATECHCGLASQQCHGGWTEDRSSTSTLMSKLSLRHDGWLRSLRQPLACFPVFSVHSSILTSGGGSREVPTLETLLIFCCCVLRAKGYVCVWNYVRSDESVKACGHCTATWLKSLSYNLVFSSDQEILLCCQRSWNTFTWKCITLMGELPVRDVDPSTAALLFRPLTDP